MLKNVGTRRYLKCRQCNEEILRGGKPHARCPEGHECEICNGILCSTCGESAELNNYQELEEFECNYHGCHVTLPRSQQENHERDCLYRPSPCPLGCGWCGTYVEDHLCMSHDIPVYSDSDSPYFAWTIVLDDNNPNEKRRWDILFECSQDGGRHNWFLVTAEQQQQQDARFGPLSVQVCHLNFHGKFSASLQSGSQEMQCNLKWKIPSLRSDKQRPVLLSEQLTQESVDATNSRVLLLFLTITPEIPDKNQSRCGLELDSLRDDAVKVPDYAEHRSSDGDKSADMDWRELVRSRGMVESEESYSYWSNSKLLSGFAANETEKNGLETSVGSKQASAEQMSREQISNSGEVSQKESVSEVIQGGGIEIERRIDGAPVLQSQSQCDLELDFLRSLGLFCSDAVNVLEYAELRSFDGDKQSLEMDWGKFFLSIAMGMAESEESYSYWSKFLRVFGAKQGLETNVFSMGSKQAQAHEWMSPHILPSASFGMAVDDLAALRVPFIPHKELVSQFLHRGRPEVTEILHPIIAETSLENLPSAFPDALYLTPDLPSTAPALLLSKVQRGRKQSGINPKSGRLMPLDFSSSLRLSAFGIVSVKGTCGILKSSIMTQCALSPYFLGFPILFPGGSGEESRSPSFGSLPPLPPTPTPDDPALSFALEAIEPGMDPMGGGFSMADEDPRWDPTLSPEHRNQPPGSPTIPPDKNEDETSSYLADASPISPLIPPSPPPLPLPQSFPPLPNLYLSHSSFSSSPSSYPPPFSSFSTSLPPPSPLFSSPHIPLVVNSPIPRLSPEIKEICEEGAFLTELLRPLKLLQYKDLLLAYGFASDLSIQKLTRKDLAEMGVRPGSQRVLLETIHKKYGPQRLAKTRKKKKPHRCLACGKGFSRKTGLDSHYENKHLNLQFRCERGCQKISNSRKQRYEHYRTCH